MSNQQLDAPEERRLNQRGAGLIASLVSVVVGFVVTVLGLRFIFRLFGANPDNAIVSWIYQVSRPLVAPFFGMFNHSSVAVSTGRLEYETLIAIVVYAVLGSIIIGLVNWGHRRSV